MSHCHKPTVLILSSVIDVHSHLGVEPSPTLNGAVDGNSEKGPIVPWLRALDGLNTHDESQSFSLPPARTP